MKRFLIMIVNFLLFFGTACSNHKLGLPEYDPEITTVAKDTSERELPKACLPPQGETRGGTEQKLTQQESVVSSDQFSKMGDTVTNGIGKLTLIKKVKPQKIVTDSKSPVQIFLHEVLLLSATELTPKARRSISMSDPDGQWLNLLQISARVENTSNEDLTNGGIGIPFCGYLISEKGKPLEYTSIVNYLSWSEINYPELPAKSKKEMIFFVQLKDFPYPKYPMDFRDATDIILRTTMILDRTALNTITEVKNVSFKFD
jgi:hypothetical protein